MRRVRLAFLFVLGAVAASVVGLSVAPAASATTPLDILTPPGYASPFDALQAGAYTPQQAQYIAARLEGYVGADGATISDVMAGLSSSESEYAIGRVLGAAAQAGAAEDIGTLALASGASFPVLAAVGAAGALAVTGYLVYKYVLTGSDGASHTEYVSLSRAALFGAQIVVPSGTIGTDYRFNDASITGAASLMWGSAPMGWIELTCSQNQRCTSMPGMSAGGKYWTFDYNATLPYYYSWSGSTPHWYNGTQEFPEDSAGNIYGAPNYSDCSGLNETACYGTMTGDSYSAPMRHALEQAASDTASSFATYNGPLPVHLDTDAAATGHMSYTFQCTKNVAAGHCLVPYVPDADFNRTLPRTVSTTDPGGALNASSPPTITAPTDIQAPSTRSTITTSLSDPCGKAILNHLIDPGGFAYYGCTQKQTPTTTTAPPPTYTVPNCIGLSVSACGSAITAAGSSSSTLSNTVVSPWTADLTKPAGAIITQNPAGGAVVNTSSTITTTSNPTTMPFQLPAPNPNETYTDYVTRLQGLGYVGTATSTTLTTAEGGYGPSSPVRITYTDNTGTQHVLDPTSWPATAPSLPVDTPLSVTVNTADAVPVPSSSSGCPCPVHNVDFGPLENLDLGSRFPFGAFAYATGFLGQFNVSPTAPSFDISVGGANVGGAHISAPGHYAGTLSFFDSWMSWWRTIMSVLIWLSAVWFVATRLLGFKAGGDPSDAMDEGAIM